MNSVLIDPNVLLDFFLERNFQPEKTVKLFSLVDDKTIEGFITLSILKICSDYLISIKGVVVTKGILRGLIFILITSISN